MSDVAIDMQDIGKRFGRQWVVAHASLRVRRGESVALFGGNGSGKSTLLKMIATLLAPSAGTLRVLGYDVRRVKRDIRRRVRFLAHEKQLYGALTVRENIALAASARGLSCGGGRLAIQPLLARWQLEAVGDRRVMQLSEGMKKRVVLTRLLIGDDAPELILLDEPHPTLDVAGRVLLDTMLQEWRARGTTILIASHDHTQTVAHVDRVIALESGSVAYDGPPKSWDALP